MTIEQFRQHMADGLPVENGSEAHNHNPDPEHRGDMTFKPIRIEDKVWLGANVTILQGVLINL